MLTITKRELATYKQQRLLFMFNSFGFSRQKCFSVSLYNVVSYKQPSNMLNGNVTIIVMFTLKHFTKRC